MRSVQVGNREDVAKSVKEKENEHRVRKESGDVFTEDGGQGERKASIWVGKLLEEERGSKKTSGMD